MKFNPFRPNSIVGPGMFAGRIDEILTIEHGFFQTKNENPLHFIIEGERGIGKSSLMFWTELYARGQVHPDNQSCNFLVISGELKETMQLNDIVQLIVSKLRRELERQDPVITAGKKIFDVVKRFEAFGVKYKESSNESKEYTLIDDLADMLNDAINSQFLCDGIVILFDEADKPAASAHLGLLCKSLTERLTKINCNRVSIGLAGLPELIGKLEESHASSPRVFETLNMQPLTMEESARVINSGLREANEKSKSETKISDDALASICQLSEGYPHFLQQFAYCAFAEDSDGTIDMNDVVTAMYRENGALHQLGRKYFENKIFVDIRSENYRRVLMAMANHGDKWVDRKDIKDEAGVSETTVNNALNALKAKKIILHSDRVRGGYRIPTKSFAVWLKAFGSMSGRAGNLPEVTWAHLVGDGPEAGEDM